MTEPEGVEACRAEARALLDRKEYPAALQACDRGLALAPRDAGLFFLRGLVRQRTGTLDAAVEDYSAALSLRPDWGDAYFNRAWCKGLLCDHPGAVEDYSRSLELSPNDAEAYISRANRRLDAGDYARAAQDYEKGASLAPAQAQELAPWKEKAERFDRLFREGPEAEFAALCCERGWAKSDAGDDATASLWFNRALDVEQNSADAWHGRGFCRSRQKRLPEAIDDLKKAAELKPDSADIWRSLAWARRTAGQNAEAIADYTKALELRKDDASALLGRAIAHGNVQNLEAAERDYTRVVELDPKNAIAWFNRGWVRRKLKRPAEAAGDLTRAIDLDARDPLAWSNRGYARRDSGDTAGAIADFRRALELDPALEGELGTQIRMLTILPAGTMPTPPAAAAPSAPAGRKPLGLDEVGRNWIYATVFVLALGFFKIPVLSPLPARVLDLPCKIGWIALHWNDPVAFPPGSNVCVEQLCTRTDTVKRHVTGRPGYRSEIEYYYCPDHESGFVSIWGKFGGLVLFFYWIIVIGLSGLVLVPPLMVLLRVLLWPWLLILVSRKKQPRAILVPGALDTSGHPLAGMLDDYTFKVAAGMLAALWIAYAWW